MDDEQRRAYRDHMPEWLAIEVFDAEFPASRWRRSHEDFLTEAAFTNGASVVDWHVTRWGVVLELCFDSDEQVERYRNLPAVRAALDSVPDPVQGLVVYRGRGGGAGASVPRRPRPVPIAGAAALPEPDPDQFLGCGLFSGERDLALVGV
jgi:hypothetical protein